MYTLIYVSEGVEWARLTLCSIDEAKAEVGQYAAEGIYFEPAEFNLFNEDGWVAEFSKWLKDEYSPKEKEPEE